MRLNTCPSLILGRRKPLLDDEQIESHAESYTYPKKCADEVDPPWHTTRVDYTTYPWHLLCNASDNHFEVATFRIINEQSVDDALCMFCKCFDCECAAKLLKNNKNKEIICYRFRKTEILVQLCHYNDRKHQPICQNHSAWYKKPCQRWHEMCR